MRLLVAFGALVLAGCAVSGPTRISYIAVDPGYRLNEFVFAGATGALRTVVTGDPFLVGRERFSQAVSQAMYGHHFGPAVEFATNPDVEVNGSYKVVMMFDAPLSAGEATVCHAPAVQPAAATTSAQPSPDQPVYVVAAFCQGNRALTNLAGVMARSGIDDPAFRDFIAQVTIRLFPAFNQEMLPDHDNDIFAPDA